MTARIKIGNEYLQEIKIHASTREHKIKTSDNPKEFRVMGVNKNISELLDAMRFGDIEKQTITIEVE